MHPKIEQLEITLQRKKRLNEIYEWFHEQILANDGEFKCPQHKDITPHFALHHSTVSDYIRQLVEIGLLARTSRHKGVYSLPTSEAVEQQPSEEIAELSDDEVALFIEAKSFMMRGQRVMLDRDVAQVYGVETRRLNEQRERNPDNFPDDFAYQMSGDEISQNAILDGIKFTHPPWSYTLEGINMSATVLKTPKAIQRSIMMVRTFSDLERMAHGEEPKQPGFAELMQMVVEQNKMLTNNIALQGKQLTDGIVEVKDDVDELETKVSDVEKKVDDLTNNELNNLIQADVDQYIHIDAYLISYQDGIAFSKNFQRTPCLPPIATSANGEGK